MEITLFITEPVTGTLRGSCHTLGEKIYLRQQGYVPRCMETRSETLCKAVAGAWATAGTPRSQESQPSAAQGPRTQSVDHLRWPSVSQFFLKPPFLYVIPLNFQFLLLSIGPWVNLTIPLSLRPHLQGDDKEAPRELVMSSGLSKAGQTLSELLSM